MERNGFLSGRAEKKGREKEEKRERTSGATCRGRRREGMPLSNRTRGRKGGENDE
jgi:hypothetical protein